MSKSNELKMITKEINEINKKIQYFSNKFELLEKISNDYNLLCFDIETIDRRLIKLEKLNKINTKNDTFNNSLNNSIFNNIDNINNLDEGKIFRYQVSNIKAKTRKNRQMNNLDNYKSGTNSKDKNIFFDIQHQLNNLEETKENKKRESKKKKSHNKSKKKENINIRNINNEININEINEENNSKYLEDNKNNINPLIINNNNDNFDIMSFGKKDENNLNYSLLTSSAKFSEFSFNPEKLKKYRNNSQPKIIDNIINIQTNKKTILDNNPLNDIINITNENIKNKLEDNLNSEIIKNLNEIQFMFNYIPNYNKFNGFPDIQTIFQSSLDGGSAKAFHKFCDSEPNLIVLVETKNGERFGGYTKIGFSSDGETKEDDTIFFFNLDKLEIYKKFKKIFRFIYCDPNNGPCFGPKNNIIFQISDNYLIDNSFIKELHNNEKNFCDISIEKKEFVVIIKCFFQL